MATIDYQREYDNSAKVPGADAILRQWVHDASAFRAAHPFAELNLAYGPTARQKLDIFWPNAGKTASLAMFIHGGYWQMLDKDRVSHLARGLVGQGVAVAVPSYDLCPAVSLAVIVDQIRQAAAFVMRRHGRGAVACGHSAGGHLTAMLLATDWPAYGLPSNAVASGTAFSGLFDLAPLLATTVNDKLGLDVAEAACLSPIRLPAPVARLTALVGGLEGAEYVRQSREIAQHWAGAWAVLPGRHHFDIVAPLADPAAPMVAALAENARAAAA